MSSLIFIVPVALYVAFAALVDIRWHRVPNYLTVPAALAGLAFHSFFPGGWGWSVSLAGFAVGFGLLLLPWLFGGGGMGDVKLLAALGAWLGPMLMLVAFALSILTAAVLALAVLMWAMVTDGLQRAQHSYLSGRIGQKAADEAKSHSPRRQRLLPFAVPVALSVWSMLAWMMLR